MIISNKFQGKFFGDYAKDLWDNYTQVFIPDMFWDDGTKVMLRKYDDYEDLDRLRWYLKIFDEHFPKKDNGEPFSMANVDNKIVINHIDYMRYVLAYNGAYFKSDDDALQQIFKENR